MTNIFKSSEEEKNRIRKLHSSVLSEQEEENVDMSMFKMDEPMMADDMTKTDVSIVEPGDGGFESSVLPAHYHVWRQCWNNAQKVYVLTPALPGTALQNASIDFYNTMGAPVIGEVIHITLVQGQIQRRMCLLYGGFIQRNSSLDSSSASFPSTATRDPGSFADCQACSQASTGPTEYCIDCAAQIMYYVPNPNNCPNCTSCSQLPGGSWVSIGPNPSPPQGPCVECQNNNCVTTGNGWSGDFNSMSDCQNSQQCQQLMWECITPGQACQQTATGTYNSQAACDAACQIQYPRYKCTGGAQGCVQNITGTFTGPTAQADCETSCCQGNITNWNWAPMPNPTCQEVCAKLNTPSLTPPITNFIHQCRYDWLVAQGCNCGGGNIACCTQTMWGINPVVNGGNGDPLGCFTTQWQDIMNDFVQNSPNWPGQGCTWLQDRLNNALSQQANYPPQSGAYCKYQGKIDMLTNFMATGTNPYITGSGSFQVPPGC